MFIEPDFAQVEASARIGADMVELHTGAFANAQGEAQHRELSRLADAAGHSHALGLQVNAGHGINYTNIALVRRIPHLEDLNIGHSIVSRSVFVGLERAVAEMLELMRRPA
jgi:pyridoxine 5-phosphate synthase